MKKFLVVLFITLVAGTSPAAASTTPTTWPEPPTSITTMPDRTPPKCPQGYCGSPNDGPEQQPHRPDPGPTPGYTPGSAERVNDARQRGDSGYGYEGPPPTTSPDTEECRSHVVIPGDTLWDLAGQMIGDSFRWRELLTNPPVANPRHMAPGTVVRFCETIYRSQGEPPSGDPE